MKAAQIKKYTKDIHIEVNEIDKPTIQANEVLIKVKVSAVNPLDLLNITGSVKLIQDYPMPLTLGNELTGKIEQVGGNVHNFKVGDAVYTRLPIGKIGAFAEFVAVDQDAIWYMPKNLDFTSAAAVPLTGLTAYQAFNDILQAKAGETVFIPGGSGSFGQMAVPIAKYLGLNVIVSGNTASKDRILAAGANLYIDYREENYWEVIDKVDYVIDTLGGDEIERELSVIKPGGTLLSLIAGPNKQFAIDQNLPKWKQILFGLAGAKLDRQAKKHQVDYRFIFVEANGAQLKEVTTIVEKANITPAIDPHIYQLNQVNEAITKVKQGRLQGKVVIQVD